jgi:hypothetical protein
VSGQSGSQVQLIEGSYLLKRYRVWLQYAPLTKTVITSFIRFDIQRTSICL